MQSTDVAAVCILRLTSTLLHFPGRATTAALTYMQHYQRHRSLLDAASRPSQPILVAACILLASKVEEVPVSTNHLLNIVSVLHELVTTQNVPLSELWSGPHQGATAMGGCRGDLLAAPSTRLQDPTHADHAMTSGPLQSNGSAGVIPQADKTAGTDAGRAESSQQVTAGDSGGATRLPQSLQERLQQCSALVGEAYYQSKGLLLEAEQQLLRLLQWKLATPHPAAALLHIAAVLQVRRQALVAAMAVLSDVAAFTALLLPGWPKAATLAQCQGQADGPSAGTAEQADEASGWGRPAEELLSKEVTVAAACMLVATESLGGDHRIRCAACKHQAHPNQGVPDNSVPAALQHATEPQTQPAGQDMAPSHGDSVPCTHWVGLLGSEPALVLNLGTHILIHLDAARRMIEQPA